MRRFLISQGFDPYKNLKMKGSCLKKLGSGNDHGYHDRRTIPVVYFLAVFKGKKITSYTFQLDSKHLSIQVKDPGPLRSWIYRRKNIRFQKRTVSEASLPTKTSK